MEQIRVLGATMLVVVSALVSPITSSAEVNGDATLTLAPRQVTDWLTLDGTVTAIHQGTVAAQTSGRVSRMLVDVNDQVVAGQPLLEISGKEQFAAVTGADRKSVV